MDLVDTCDFDEFYYEQQIKRELQVIHICGCRSVERLMDKLMDLRVSHCDTDPSPDFGIETNRPIPGTRG